ncbi:MAG TPA: hypothetical protein PKD85_14150, partial [Saprospiraceae bacterium]|nr:hypothetical protein [Saprospiraceae bacterium]
TNYLSLFISGIDKSENWQSKPKKTDFYDMKRMVLKVLHGLGIHQFKTTILVNNKRLAYGLSLSLNDVVLAEFGLIHPKIGKAMDVRNEVYYGEINLDKLYELTTSNIQLKPINKFPTVTRDLAFVLDKNIAYTQLEGIGKKMGYPLLSSMTMFDHYDNEKHVGEGKKSIALRFVFEDGTKTLTDQDIDQKMKSLIDCYTEELGAILRS